MTASLNHQLTPVRTEADILPAWRDTPVGDLLRFHNLGAPHRDYSQPALVLGICMEIRQSLALPPGFAHVLRTAAASLKRVPFDVSWGIGIAGAGAIALVGHTGCGMVNLRQHREDFVARLMAVGGWERPAAEQHFDHWSDLFEVEDPAAFLLAETRRLQSRYPRLLVAPLLLDTDSGRLQQVLPG
jgi:carbonic anhydrase